MAVLNKRAVVSAIEMYGVSAIRLPMVLGESFNQIIKSLFANGEQGFAYDPNDLTTMFQDAAGTVPVTGAGQPVELVLDKSKGLALGTNAVLNGDFSQGGTSWGVLGGVTFSGGKAVYDGLNNPSIYQSVPNIELGAFYKVRFTISNLVKDALAVRIGTGAFTFGFNQNKTYEVILPAIGSGVLQFPTAGSGAVLELSDISVKKLSGNHAYQTQSAMRPLLVASPQRLDYDIADDKLITTLPAQLTGCTVIRSVPNVGTQILTGQTIPATYIDNIDHCGLIVINRALTATETSQITKLFNKAAGV